MFTGLIKTKANVLDIQSFHGGSRCVFECDVTGVSLGDSIAINGVCSTVTDLRETSFTVEYLVETLHKTTFSYLQVGQSVNIEYSLTPADKLGGHFVQGHVDTVGEIVKLTEEGPWHVIYIAYDQQFDYHFVSKGSICIDGISLTVVDVAKGQFSCHIIPHTFHNTTFSQYTVGTKVNLEFDVLGKYIYNYLRLREEKHDSE
ncbi:riboflavin synthase [Candidatus Marinamargulisbacteria bacterium SCGC AG-414-C22]|nr:riboflavin synthase [Candidatus Marinamargulisbacteria bacterium SCGC AG-414-C22]